MSVSDYSVTPASNVAISGINVAEGCAPANMNNAVRQLMADAKEEQTAKNAEIAAAVLPLGDKMDKSSNLSDVASVSTALDNLGLADTPTAKASTAEALAGTEDTKFMTPAKTADAINAVPFAGLEYRTGTFTSAIDTDQTVTFSSPFPNAVLSVQLLHESGAANFATNIPRPVGRTGFQFNRFDTTDGTHTLRYFAIGN